MSLPSAIKLFIEPRNGQAFGNFSGSSQISKPTFTLGDTAGVEIYLVESTQVASYPRQELPFPVSPGIKVAVGAIDEAPASGTWSMSFGGNTTTALAFNVTATLVQTALNALASITAAGGVTVSKIGDNYNITFNQNGARDVFTTDGSALVPLSSATVAVLQAGSSTKPCITMVHLQRTVAGLATTFNQTEASQISIETLGAWDGSKATYRLSISPDPKGGSFTLAFDAQTGADVSTSSINVGATALDVQNVLNINSLVDNVKVTQVGAYSYDITVSVQPGASGLTANDSGILSFQGYMGELSLNTAEAISLLDGADSIETVLEVEITSDSKTLTLLQIPCILKNSVIDAGTIEPLVLDTYLSQTTADGRYLRQSNNLSDVIASTARSNLDVYSTGDVDTALSLKASDSDLLLKLPLAGGAMDLNALVTLSNSTSDSEIGGWGFGVELTADPTQQASIGHNYIEVMSGGTGVHLTPAGITFPDSTVQSSAAVTFDPTGYATESFVTSQGYLVSSSLNGYATESWVYGQNYTTLEAAQSWTQAQGYLNFDSNYRLTFPSGINPDPSPLPGRFWFQSEKFRYSTSTAQLNALASEGWVSSQGFLTSASLSGYAQLSGATFTGKIILSPGSTVAPINIGTSYSPASSINGDVWMGTNTVSYKDGAGLVRTLTVNGLTNTFSAPQIVDTTATTAALRVTQKGTGNAIEVEDSTTPDSTRFVVDQFGKVGIGVAPDTTAALKIDGNGLSFNGLVFNPTSTAAHTGGSDTLDLMVTINGTAYRIGLRPA